VHVEEEEYDPDDYLDDSTARFLALNSVTLKHVFDRWQ
jgi:hypothetical protein